MTEALVIVNLLSINLTTTNLLYSTACEGKYAQSFVLTHQKRREVVSLLSMPLWREK